VPKADGLWYVQLWEKVGSLPCSPPHHRAGGDVLLARGSLCRHHSSAPTQVPAYSVTLAIAMSALAEEERDLLGY